MRTRKILLLDTASLYFRAFYGVPDSLRSPDGLPVNAVRGLLDFIARLVDVYSPTHVACCWDNDWRPAWRVALLPSYKAHRVAGATPAPGPHQRDQRDVHLAPTPPGESAPDDLATQVPWIREVLTALGIRMVGADGYEADDVIGTLATTLADPGRRGDRRPRPLPGRRRRPRGARPLHRPRRGQARAGGRRLGAEPLRRAGGGVRRLRHPARRRVRRSARGLRDRRQDRRQPDRLLRRPRGHPRRRQRTRTPGSARPCAPSCTRRSTTSPSPPRSSPSPATSTSA